MSEHTGSTTTSSAFGTFFATVGRGIRRAAVSTHEAVDPDARRDLAWMPVVALASLGPRRLQAAALPDDGHRPVVFVHGLAGYRGNFLPMRSWFRLHGRTRTYAVGLSGRTIPQMAVELRSYIADVVQVNNLSSEQQVDVVAHSMGGLVGRLALRDPDTAQRVHTLVTLGTPHRGTHAARFTGGELMSALRRDSALMTELGSDFPWRRSTRLICFWSANDPLMQPAETARVEGADNREVLSFSHLDWLMRRQAWMELDAVLRS